MRPSKTLLFLLLALPFFLNDFINIMVADYELWLGLDLVAAKAVPLALLWLFMGKKWLDRRDAGLAWPGWTRFAAWGAALALAGLALDQLAWPFFKRVLPGTGLGAIPLDTASPLYPLDLTLGLALVAVVEEIVFRGAALAACRERGYGPAATVAASALVFGLIHWSTGLHAILATAAIGAVFMAGTLATGSALPAMAAHFLVNLASFSGLLAPTVN